MTENNNDDNEKYSIFFNDYNNTMGNNKFNTVTGALLYGVISITWCTQFRVLRKDGFDIFLKDDTDINNITVKVTDIIDKMCDLRRLVGEGTNGSPLCDIIIDKFLKMTPAISFHDDIIDGLEYIQQYNNFDDKMDTIQLLKSDDDIVMCRIVGGKIFYNNCIDELQLLYDYFE